MSADDLVAGVLADRGGESETTTLERACIRKIGDLHIIISLLTTDIARHGLFTPGGRVRDVSDKLMVALGAFDRYAQRIGLDRRQRRVHTLDQILDSEEATDGE